MSFCLPVKGEGKFADKNRAWLEIKGSWKVEIWRGKQTKNGSNFNWIFVANETMRIWWNTIVSNSWCSWCIDGKLGKVQTRLLFSPCQDSFRTPPLTSFPLLWGYSVSVLGNAMHRSCPVMSAQHTIKREGDRIRAGKYNLSDRCEGNKADDEPRRLLIAFRLMDEQHWCVWSWVCPYDTRPVNKNRDDTVFGTLECLFFAPLE